ncbi:MAG: RtcB family protein, partial [Victivallaceae bacterium]
MKWIKFETEYKIPVKSWCEEVEPGALKQAANLANHPVLAHHVALMPDCHQGYGMPIGGVVAARDAVIPSAVGVDIGCGMVAVETGVPAERLQSMQLRRAIQERLKELIPVGEGGAFAELQAWDGFEAYLEHNGRVADFPNTLDRRNLGTLGGGNHFIEIQQSDDNMVWLMIHSGSRNLGKRIEEFYHHKALKLNQMYHVKLSDPELAFLPLSSQEGHDYFRDMLFALR